ncbi:MAG: 50S ribosomal protein L13 [Cytophagaceae bacterium]|nr:50S ribosomal protein L13 [Cytophagaceae bacterium]
MDSLSYKTQFVNKENVSKQWIIVDADSAVLGRLASEVAKIIRGKHKPSYTPYVDCGDNVIIINAEKIRLTGRKMDDKVYISHTGYPGGQRFKTPRELMEKNPKGILESAVRGMLPKNRIGRALFRNLYVYEGAEHPHAAQNPKTVKI